MIKNIEDEYCRVSIFRVSDSRFINYSYIITDKITKDCILIDPAWEINVFINYIENEQLTPVYILLTHHHWDHTNLAALLAERYACDLAISEHEQRFLREHPKTIGLFHNQDILLGSQKIVCILTPGHTRGSMCYLLGSFLFTGDTLFIEGVGNCTEYKDGLNDLYQSILYLKNNVGKEVLLLPGHKYEFDFEKTFGEVQYLNIYFHFPNLEEFSKFRMRSAGHSHIEFK